MSGSTAFDRAAAYYDATRGWSLEGAARETAVLAAELSGRGPVLEVGVGTGQVGMPLFAQGVPLLGMDLSRPMLDVLLAKAAGEPPFPLVQADATRMPFADDAFGGVILRWVLHLIPDWEGALGEIARVVGTRGVLIVQLGGPGDGVAKAIRERFTAEADIDGRPVGLDWTGYEHLDAAMAFLDATPRDLPTFTAEDAMSVEGFMAGIEANAYSWTWPLAESTLAAAAAVTRAWAEATYGPLDALEPARYEVTWRAYDLP